MMTGSRLAFAALLLLFASPAFAGGEGGSAGEPPPAAKASATPSKPPSFDALSAGDRKIARALFIAQHPTTNGPAPLSLNQIADLKAGDSWAKVFKQMQTSGLIQAKTLGQVVEGYEHQRRSEGGTASGRAGQAILVTNGHGEVVASTRSKRGDVAHGGGEVVEPSTFAVAAAATQRPEKPEKPERGERPERRR